LTAKSNARAGALPASIASTTTAARIVTSVR
jgi:hypothetical protein